MTDKEKAKAYDEAIMVAKSCLKKGTNPANDPLDYFIDCVCKMFPDSFPELAESEDERIRKTLLRCCDDWEKGQFGCMAAEDVPKIRVYLEKQKEQKPNIKICPHSIKSKSYSEQKPATFSELYNPDDYEVVLEGNATSLRRKEQKPAECIEDSVKFEEGFKAGRESGLRDGQKYVLNNLDSYGLCKPAEWNEEDENKLYQVMETLLADKAIALRENPHCKALHRAYDEMIDWLKSLPERFNLQPKQEWSEEDEKRIQSILFSVGYCKEEYPNKKDYSKDINWLKSLRPHPHWKPSEQEKGALRTAIHILTDERNFPKAAAHLQNILDDFEGEESRKEWKPSKEQMETLENVITKMAMYFGEHLYNCEMHTRLKSLYNDLKKLM